LQRKKHKHKKKIQPGSAPGIYPVQENQKAEGDITLIKYNENCAGQQELDQIHQFKTLKEENFIHWLLIKGVDNSQFIKEISNEFGLHPLVLNDIMDLSIRPKINDFDDYLFISLEVPFYEQKTRELSEKQLSLVIGTDYLISFQEDKTNFFLPLFDRILKSKGHIRKMKTDFLVYAIIDLVVDHYTLIMQEFEEHIDSLEDIINTSDTRDILSELYNNRHSLTTLRRGILPLREIIRNLERGYTQFIGKNTFVFFHDVYDHSIYIIESIESFRDILATTHDIYLSLISNKMNEIMKVLTIFSSIFIPLTFIAGLYGMNFKFMPELEWHWGYPVLLCIMLVVSGIMLLYFKKKKWLGKDKKKQKTKVLTGSTPPQE